MQTSTSAVQAAPAAPGQWPHQLLDLMAGLGRHWGVAELAPDGMGRAALAFDAEPPLQLDLVCEGVPLQLQLRVELGALPARGDAGLLLELLRLNRLGSQGNECCAVLADDETNTVWWLQNVPWRGMDIGTFIHAVEAFLAVAHDLMGSFDPPPRAADKLDPTSAQMVLRA